ncbi:MAG: DUF4125 family protein [Mailhella sp.]|nr:DUF4125 family protein [Mailhella sp.]
MERTLLIEELCSREWVMFSAVNNRGGKASCQNDEDFFKKMRACQFKGWSDEMLASYRQDLIDADACGRNLPMEKYAWMMESTHPSEFMEVRASLPEISLERLELVRELVDIQVRWEAEVDSAYPFMRAGGRPLRKSQDTPWVTSFETYMDGELKTYSLETLRRYREHVRRLSAEGRNLAFIVAEHTAKAYGFDSLEAAEARARRRAEQKG